MRIAVCRPQVPFVRGGAELVADDLVRELRVRGHEAEMVTRSRSSGTRGRACSTRRSCGGLLDLTEADGREIELVIATKFPSYCVRHPNKVAWVLHQFRQAYDYDRTELGQFSESPEDRATRAAVERLDRVALGEARKVFATSQQRRRPARALHGVDAELLPQPPQALPYRTAEPERFVLSVNRLDRAKRIDLLIEAAKAEPSLRVVIAGEGPDRERLEGLAARTERPGRVHRPRRRRAARRPLRPLPRRLLRAGRRGLRDGAVRGVPVREAGRDDHRCGRAARDRPRPRDGRRRRARGRGARATRARTSAAHVDEAKAWGRAGKAVAERVTWDGCIDALLAS